MMNMTKPRPIPHNLEAEASVLGGVLLRNDTLVHLPELEVEHFFDPRHRVVWSAMRNLEAARKPLDVVTLEAEIARSGKLDAIGGMAFLGELAIRVPTVDNVVAYAAIVRERAMLRRLAVAGAEILERATSGVEDATEVLGEAMALLARIDTASPDQTIAIGDLAQRRIAELERMAEARARGETVHSGVPTGIATLDTEIGGYPLGDISLLAARPGMGKTAMAMAATDAATLAGFGVHVFSQEGGWRMYADRAIAKRAGVSVSRMRSGHLRAGEPGRIGEALVELRRRQNWKVDPSAGKTVDQIIRSVRQHKASNKTKLVVIDYVQILKRPRGLEDNENAAIDQNITALSHAALAEDMAFLVISQLNRKVEDRPDKRPQLADLRGSGSLEERPRVIVAPFRGAYYYDKPKKGVDYECECVPGAPCRHEPTDEDFAKQVQVLLLKNNNGATGRVFAEWIAETTEMR